MSSYEINAAPPSEPTLALPESPVATPAVPFRLTVTIDQLLYVLFFILALLLRLVQLGTILLNDAEAHEALAVFRVIDPNAAGTQLIPHSPLMFTVNALFMAIGGANNVSARIGTVIISLAIILMPLLFRRWIGRTQALIGSGLLALSPVLLTDSRTMSGPVWTLALALGVAWSVGRFAETRRLPFAVIASALIGLLLVGTEPAGFWGVILLAVGLIFALLTGDDPDHAVAQTVRQTLAAWPIGRALLSVIVTLAIIGTVFLLHTDGLSAFGEVVSRAVQGFVYRAAQNPVAFPLLTSLLYEPVLWVFGLIGAWLTLREDGGFIQRGLVGWLMAGVIACLVYPGAGAEHALWLTLPLAGLATVAIERIITPISDRFWNVPVWGPWLHGLGVVATLSISAVRLLYVGRAALNVAPALIPEIGQGFHLLLVVLTIVLLVILYFLVGSVWGGRAAWHGLGVGVFLFLGVYSLGSGWRASVVNADDPREFWRPHPVSQNLTMLETALINTSLRATGMPYDMPLSVVWSDDGALAWLLRRYEHAKFVTQTSAALNGPAVIAPKADAKPQLGAAYVGEPFSVYSTWDRGTMQYWDIVPWIYSRETRVGPTVTDSIVLWVRSDVYGIPPDNLTAPVK